MTNKTYLFILFLGLVLGLASVIFLLPEEKNELNRIFTGSTVSLAKPALADNIYPLFFCPCCGQPLDKNNICCGQARERIDYIDSLVNAGISEDEVILTYVKKYGLNSFVDENKQKEVRSWLAASAPVERPIISLAPDSYDFGDVSQKGDEVHTLFEIKNEGKTNLVINRLDTSCGCTSASIVFNGQEGPRFAMAGHGIKSPTDWQAAIPPGETVLLKVYYDPSVHPDFRGFAVREIYIFSNDPVDFEKKVVVELNQVD